MISSEEQGLLDFYNQEIDHLIISLKHIKFPELKDHYDLYNRLEHFKEKKNLLVNKKYEDVLKGGCHGIK